MKKERVNYFKEKLLKEKAALEEELNSIGRQDPNGDWSVVPLSQEGAEPDEADQADFVEDFESRIGRLGSLETKYVQIIDALKRVEDGTYGRCLKSGALIEEDRLEANPAAETCKAMMNA
jgi:RNA polymerase-binding transcription factor DksA